MIVNHVPVASDRRSGFIYFQRIPTVEVKLGGERGVKMMRVKYVVKLLRTVVFARQWMDRERERFDRTYSTRLSARINSKPNHCTCVMMMMQTHVVMMMEAKVRSSSLSLSLSI